MSVSSATTDLLNATSNTTSSTTKTASSSLGKDDFLTLLVTQIKNQDPLQPQADTEFVAQLAQFSSLEQLTNIASDVSDIKGNAASDMVSAMNYMGKKILSTGNTISVSSGTASTAYLTTSAATANLYMNIYDSDGNLIRTDNVGSKAAGSFTYTWDGKDSSGQTVSDGSYYLKAVGEDTNGKAITVSTEVTGTVNGVIKDSSGTYLIMDDGTYVNYANVTQVVTPTSSTSTDTSTN